MTLWCARFVRQRLEIHLHCFRARQVLLRHSAGTGTRACLPRHRQARKAPAPVPQYLTICHHLWAQIHAERRSSAQHDKRGKRERSGRLPTGALRTPIAATTATAHGTEALSPSPTSGSGAAATGTRQGQGHTYTHARTSHLHARRPIQHQNPACPQARRTHAQHRDNQTQTQTTNAQTLDVDVGG